MPFMRPSAGSGPRTPPLLFWRFAAQQDRIRGSIDSTRSVLLRGVSTQGPAGL